MVSLLRFTLVNFTPVKLVDFDRRRWSISLGFPASREAQKRHDAEMVDYKELQRNRKKGERTRKTK
jgi:hypothetical protein